jgi:hypothetical protein
VRAAGRPPNFARAYRSVPRAFRAAVFTLGGSFAPPGKRALNLNSVQLGARGLEYYTVRLARTKLASYWDLRNLGMVVNLVLV